MKSYFVYIMANRKHGVLYVGVTNDLIRRVNEHKNDLSDGFTKKYKVHKLVHYEETGDIAVAIWREKCIKRWYRHWKIDLIEETNPEWNDLYHDLVQ
jgi:putative endonuclease